MNKRHKKRLYHEFDWRKPRFYRSSPKVVKIDPSRPLTHNRIVPVNLTTKWDLISEETFEELKKKGMLTPDQIAQCEERFGGKKTAAGGLGRGMGWLTRHPDADLIREIAKLDLLTIEGIRDFKKIVDRNPHALDLVGHARKLRDKQAG